MNICHGGTEARSKEKIFSSVPSWQKEEIIRGQFLSGANHLITKKRFPLCPEDKLNISDVRLSKLYTSVIEPQITKFAYVIGEAMQNIRQQHPIIMLTIKSIAWFWLKPWTSRFVPLESYYPGALRTLLQRWTGYDRRN